LPCLTRVSPESHQSFTRYIQVCGILENFILCNSKKTEYNSVMSDEFVELPRDVEDLEDSLTEQERQLDRLDSFFSGLDSSFSLMISRIKPTWCQGILDEVRVADADTEINIAYFIENWGGQLLQVKVRGKRGQWSKGYLVPLYSYPPLVWGDKVTKKDLENPTPDPVSEKPIQSPNPVVVQNSGLEKLVQVLPILAPMVSEYFKNQEVRRQSDLTLMAEMMRAQSNSGGLGDITKIGTVMGQLNEIFKQNSSDNGNIGEMDFMNNALSVLQNVLGSNQQNQQIPAKPMHSLKPPGKPNVATPPSASVTPLIQPPKIEPPMGLAQSISAMDDRSAAQTIVMALGLMPEDKRNLTVDRLTEYQDTMDSEMDEGQENYDAERGRK
jgi:hypothetical protein